jgi:hypothetical protein
MSTFSINEAAFTEIQRIFRQMKCHDPVAQLYETADPRHLFEELKAELLERKMTPEAVEILGKTQYEKVGNQLKSSLMVGVSERAEFQPENLYEINGITFVMDASVAKWLDEYCLTFEEGRFLLRGADNIPHTLRSLAEKEIKK